MLRKVKIRNCLRHHSKRRYPLNVGTAPGPVKTNTTCNFDSHTTSKFSRIAETFDQKLCGTTLVKSTQTKMLKPLETSRSFSTDDTKTLKHSSLLKDGIGRAGRAPPPRHSERTLQTSFREKRLSLFPLSPMAFPFSLQMEVFPLPPHPPPPLQPPIQL